MKYSCSNCKWEGEELSKRPKDPLDNKCPACGDEVIAHEEAATVVEKKKKFLDVDGDGDVDRDDLKAAVKKLGFKKGKKRK